MLEDTGAALKLPQEAAEAGSTLPQCWSQSDLQRVIPQGRDQRGRRGRRVFSWELLGEAAVSSCILL